MDGDRLSSSNQSRSGPQSPISPLVAFIVLTCLVAAGVIVFYAVAGGGGPGRGVPQGQPGLSDRQAISRLHHLMSINQQVAATRDLSLLDSVFTSDSPLRPRALRLLQRLRQANVRDVSKVRGVDIDVRENTPSHITLSFRRVVFPCYVGPKGQDLTKGPSAIRQRGTWIMKPEGDAWLLFDSKLSEDEAIQRDAPSCP